MLKTIFNVKGKIDSSLCGNEHVLGRILGLDLQAYKYDVGPM